MEASWPLVKERGSEVIDYYVGMVARWRKEFCGKTELFLTALRAVVPGNVAGKAWE